MSNRSTSDLVLLIVATVVALAVLVVGVGIVLLALLYPEYGVGEAVAAYGHVIGLMTGAILGYIAGKSRSPQPGA